MINLLPPTTKEQYDYSRRNVHLLHWVVAFAFALVGLLAIGTTGLVYMQHLASNYQSQIEAKNDSLANQKLAQTQAQAKDISNSLKLSVQVLSKEVLFSKLLEQLATVTPNNVTLSTLNISQTTGALDITANTTSYEAATQLQVNLQDPANKIFSKADIINITCSNGNKNKYPCQVTLRALFANDNPFLFINAGKQ